jgi:ribonuclease HI
MHCMDPGHGHEEVGAIGGGAGFVAYTDGVCIHPGTKRHVGVYSVFIASAHASNAVRCTREGHITNQTMELAGALAGLEALDVILASASAVEAPLLYTSSNYVMCCMTRWLPRWERTGWITKQRRAVQNGDILRKMAEIMHRRNVRFVYVAIVDLIGTRPEGGVASPDASEPSVVPVVLTQRIRDGMASARQLLVDATSTEGGGSTSSTGCSKRRNVLCTWMGG